MKELPHVEGGLNPCLHCPPIKNILPMTRVIAVGFGDARVTADGVTIWEETPNTEEFWQVQEAEGAATKAPEKDWRIILYGPLHGEVYQRQGTANWVLVERNEGFA